RPLLLLKRHRPRVKSNRFGLAVQPIKSNVQRLLRVDVSRSFFGFPARPRLFPRQNPRVCVIALVELLATRLRRDGSQKRRGHLGAQSLSLLIVLVRRPEKLPNRFLRNADRLDVRVPSAEVSN